MKLIPLLIFLLISFFPKTALTQTDFRKGFIITANNEKIEDSLRLWKGQLAGKDQKIYHPAEVKQFSIGTVNYISYSNDFYKEIASDSSVGLYQKLSNNRDELVYNGIEPIGFLETTDGTIGDLFILTEPLGKLKLISKRDVKSYFLKLVANESLVLKTAWESLSYRQIKKVLVFEWQIDKRKCYEVNNFPDPNILHLHFHFSFSSSLIEGRL